MSIQGKETGSGIKNVLEFIDPKKNVIKPKWAPKQIFLSCNPKFISQTNGNSKKKAQSNNLYNELFVDCSSNQLIDNDLSACSSSVEKLETVKKGQDFTVIIDYAHTPDTLQIVLITAKEMAKKSKGRLLVLFGCAGNRDHEKRPKMGRVASDIADYLIITEDNPRSENSPKIIREIMYGMSPRFRNYVLIQNRHKAIKHIINLSQENDVIVLAGRGHETCQILKDKTIPFNDREEAANAILYRLSVS